MDLIETSKTKKSVLLIDCAKFKDDMTSHMKATIENLIYNFWYLEQSKYYKYPGETIRAANDGCSRDNGDIFQTFLTVVAKGVSRISCACVPNTRNNVHTFYVSCLVPKVAFHQHYKNTKDVIFGYDKFLEYKADIAKIGMDFRTGETILDFNAKMVSEINRICGANRSLDAYSVNYKLRLKANETLFKMAADCKKVVTKKDRYEDRVAIFCFDSRTNSRNDHTDYIEQAMHTAVDH